MAKPKSLTTATQIRFAAESIFSQFTAHPDFFIYKKYQGRLQTFKEVTMGKHELIIYVTVFLVFLMEQHFIVMFSRQIPITTVSLSICQYHCALQVKRF